MEQNKRKIVDCFMFYNELKMLYYRLDTLYDYVDYFILVESKFTHANNPKELYYNNYKSLFRKFNHKIINIIIDKFPEEYNDNYKRENYQRNVIDDGIRQLNLSNDDLIIISDVDEIPNPNIINILRNQSSLDNIYSLNMDVYYYNLNKKTNEFWTAVKILPYRIYKYKYNSKPNTIRGITEILINNGGWHLSYFGDANFIKNKLENFMHYELLNGVNNNKEIIEKRIKNNQDVCGREYYKIEHIEYKDNNNLPPNYEELIKLFETNYNYF